MVITASKLRENVYTLLDEVLDTGKPLEVTRKGRLVRIVPDKPPSKLSRLKRRDCVVGDPESIVHLDWLNEWTELKK